MTSRDSRCALILGLVGKKAGMPVSCCAVGCANRYKKGSGLGFFRFPADLQRRETWVKAVSRAKWCPSTHDRLCGDHFVGKKPSDDPNDVDYVPTIFTDSKGQRSTPIKRGGEQLECLERQKQRQLELEVLAAAPDPADPDPDLAISGFTPSTSDTAHDPAAEPQKQCLDVGMSVSE